MNKSLYLSNQFQTMKPIKVVLNPSIHYKIPTKMKFKMKMNKYTFQTVNRVDQMLSSSFKKKEKLI